MRKGTTYHQLSYEERIQIALLKEQGESIRSIAKKVCRSPNTIAKELQEKMVNGLYIPKKAQHKTYWHRYRSKINCMKVAVSKELTNLLYDKLPLGWSPERIAGYARRLGYPVSKKAVYKYIKSRCLERYLFRRRFKKRGGYKRSHMSSKDIEKRPISQRPAIVVSGHWELDFIVSRQSAAVLLVMVDIWTRYALIYRLERKTHQGVLDALAYVSNRYLVKTITTDNDIVFRGWKAMESYLSALFFFCQPYHSWEKGLIENTNRWIRCFVAKKRDIATVTDDEIHSIEVYLNETPRQCLGYRTAQEVLLGNQVS